MVPTPFDGIYFRRVNRLERDFDQDLISPERLEWQVAGEYYLWTTLWYATLFTGIYAMGGQYKTNARIILALISGGIVIGSIQKNIQINKQIKNK
jgi:hypothetical protein